MLILGEYQQWKRFTFIGEFWKLCLGKGSEKYPMRNGIYSCIYLYMLVCLSRDRFAYLHGIHTHMPTLMLLCWRATVNRNRNWAYQKQVCFDNVCFSTPSLRIINCVIFTERANQSSLRKSRQQSYPKMGNSELTLPILTSPPDLAPSDSTVSINHIFLPKTKVFQILQGMWQGFENISKAALNHFEQRQLHENPCCLAAVGQVATLICGSTSLSVLKLPDSCVSQTL